MTKVYKFDDGGKLVLFKVYPGLILPDPEQEMIDSELEIKALEDAEVEN